MFFQCHCFPKVSSISPVKSGRFYYLLKLEANLLNLYAVARIHTETIFKFSKTSAMDI